jgi:prepilin-type N-terminal cleavage/methylation domain-containing protein
MKTNRSIVSAKAMAQKGFTLIELLFVIAIVGILGCACNAFCSGVADRRSC